MATVRTTTSRSDSGGSGASRSSNNKKRKRSSASRSKARSHLALPAAVAVAADDASAVDNVARITLERHAKWQLCTQRNLSEIRIECMNVRRALARVESVADLAAAQVADDSAAARTARALTERQASATVALVENVQRDVENASAAVRADVEGVKKRARALDQRVQQLATQSIDEDFLMTQLTELQERHDAELATNRNDLRSELAAAQQSLTTQLEQLASATRTDHAALETQLTAAATQTREQLERAHDASRHELPAAVTRATAVLDKQLQAIARRVHDLERQASPMPVTPPPAVNAHAPDGVDAARLHAALGDNERRCERHVLDLEHRMDRKLDAAVAAMSQQQLQLQQQQHNSYHASYHHHQRPGSMDDDPMAVREQLHRLGRDVHRLADDVHRLAQRSDARHDELRDAFAAQLREVRSELFTALRFDARMHAVENTRTRELLDASHREVRDGLDARVRDLVELSVRDIRAGMNRLDDTVRRMAAVGRRPRSRSRSRSPMGRRHRPLSPSHARPPPTWSADACRDTGGFYHESTMPPPHLGSGCTGRPESGPSYARPRPPRRSRSRSRSPGGRGMRRRSPERRTESPPPRPLSSSVPTTLPSLPRPTESVSTATAVSSCGSSRDASAEPDRARSHTSTSTVSRDASPQPHAPVAIDICSGGESDTADATSTSASDAALVSASTPAPASTSTPTPVPPALLRRTKKPRTSREVIVIEDDDDDDDDDSAEHAVAPDRAPPDIVMEDRDTRPRMTIVHETDVTDAVPDHCTTLDDLQLGALLYFCYSGAPSLDAEWTRCVTNLREVDCVDTARVTGLLHRHPTLEAFPPYFAQFVVQAHAVVGAAASAPLAPPAPTTAGATTVLERIDPALVRNLFDRVVDTIRRSWAKQFALKLQALSIQHASSATAAQIALHPQLLASASTTPPSLEHPRQQRQQLMRWQCIHAEALWTLLRTHYGHNGAQLPMFSDETISSASPGVFVFLLLFEPTHVHRLNPQRATFRLTTWGRALALMLWDSLLSQLPYLLFADCAWLEHQTIATDDSAALPLLGLCHILTALLAWNSVGDATRAGSSSSFHSELMRCLLECLFVNSVHVLAPSSACAVGIPLGSATAIELRDVDGTLVRLLELDGFFDVAHVVATASAPVLVSPVLSAELAVVADAADAEMLLRHQHQLCLTL